MLKSSRLRENVVNVGIKLNGGYKSFPGVVQRLINQF